MQRVQRWRSSAQFIGLVACYFAAGKLGLSFAVVNHSTSAVWPPTGVALAVLLLFGPRLWPAIFLGAFLVNWSTTGAVLASVGIACGNTLEGVVGASLVRRHAGGADCFMSVRGLFGFVTAAALLSPAISATIGVISLGLTGADLLPDVSKVWFTWWLGDAVGALTVAPLLVLWLRRPALAFPRHGNAEAMLAVLFSIAIGVGVFLYAQESLAYLCIVPLAWIAFRFGQQEMTAALLGLWVVAIWGTLRGTGPFAVPSHSTSLLLLQTFMATMSVVMLLIVALVTEQRAAVREAATANRAKDDFLSMLSHELRNPLHAISTAASLLRQPGLVSPNGSQALDVVRRQTDHLSRLVADLLDVTRAINGAMDFTCQPVQLDQAVQRAMDELAASGHRRDQDIRVQIAPICVLADPVRLHQVLCSLIGNALKFTPRGGRIDVTGARVGAHGVLRVQDSGIGITPDLLPRLFEPFSQAERGLDRRDGGLGIGLTLARQFIDSQGGSIEASSPGAGKGSTFVVRLPIAETPAVAAEPSATIADANGLRVLVVEDNDDARTSLCDLLAAIGYDVHQAADGSAGVEQARRVQPDVALVDIGLPELDGYEVARRIKQLGASKRVIALTGYGRSEDRERARQAGFDDHLIKPVTLDQLRSSLAGGRRR